MRYQRDYLLKVPIPDPEQTSSRQVQRVIDSAQQLKEITREYRDAQKVLDNPKMIFEGSETGSLSYAGYVDQINLGNAEGELSPSRDGTTVRLNVQDSIDFVDEESATAFTELIDVLGVSRVGELQQLDLPNSETDLQGAIDAYQEAEAVSDESVDRALSQEEVLTDQVIAPML
jgi:hypothetical protein